MSELMEDNSSTPRRHRFQFSLRSLLLFSLVFAIVCAGLFNPYTGLRYLMLLAVQGFLFYLYLSWAIYGGGYLRTFSIGAALSFVFPWLATAYFWIVLPIAMMQASGIRMGDVAPGLLDTKTFSDGLQFFWPSILAFVLLIDSLFTGASMVIARWLLDRARRNMPSA